MQRSFKMAFSFRHRIDRAIQDAIATGIADAWDRVGLVVLDTTSAYGRETAERLGELVKWADDGKTAIAAMTRERFDAGLHEWLDEDDAKRVCAATGALVACLADKDDSQLVCVGGPMGTARDILSDHGPLLKIVRRALMDRTAYESWNDVGIAIVDMTQPDGQRFAARFGHAGTDEHYGMLVLTLHSSDLLESVQRELLAAFDVGATGALIACVLADADAAMLKLPKPTADWEQSELESTIEQLVRDGRAQAWGDVGGFMVDWTNPFGRALVTEAFPTFVPSREEALGLEAIPVLGRKRTMLDTLVALGFKGTVEPEQACIALMNDRPDKMTLLTLAKPKPKPSKASRKRTRRARRH